jgi:hypothetical protein
MKKIILLVIGLILLSGCGSTNKFVGEWYYYGSSTLFKIVFFDDNKCEAYEENEKVDNCSYTYDSETITIKYDDEDQSVSYRCEEDYLIINNIRLYKNSEKAKEYYESTGPYIPDIVGMELDEGLQKIRNTGIAFVHNIIYEESDEIEKGKIIETNPKAGEKVDVNELRVFDIVVSTGIS